MKLSFPLLGGANRLALPSLFLPLCLLIGPILLLRFPALPFANDNLCDEWYVFGLFHNLPEAVRWWPRLRQPGRFAEILPGFLVTKVLPNTFSDYLLFLMFFGLSTFFIFKTVETLFSKRRAALATILFVCSPIVIGLYGVSYDAPIVTYEIISLYGVARALKARDRGACLAWMLISGFAWGGAINAHLASASFGGFSYLFFGIRILLKRSLDLRSRTLLVFYSAGAVLLGVAFLHLVLAGVAALFFHASPWIVLNQVFKAARIFAKEKSSTDWDPHWYLRGAKTGMFLIGLTVAVTYLLGSWQKARQPLKLTASERHTLAIALAFVVSCGLWAAFEMAGGIFLQYDSYYVMMWPFLALTVFAGDLGWDGDRAGWLVLGFLAAFLVCLAPGAVAVSRISTTDPAVIPSVVALTVAVLCGLTLAVYRPFARVLIAAGVLGLLAFTGIIVRPNEGSVVWSHHGGASRRSYQRIHEGIEFTQSLVHGSPRSPVVWTNEGDILDGAGFADSYLYCDVGKNFPEVDPEDVPVARGYVVALARPKEDLAEQLEAAARNLNIKVRTVGTKVLKDERGPYNIVVMYVIEAPED